MGVSSTCFATVNVTYSKNQVKGHFKNEEYGNGHSIFENLVQTLSHVVTLTELFMYQALCNKLTLQTKVSLRTCNAQCETVIHMYLTMHDSLLFLYHAISQTTVCIMLM